MEPTKIKQSDDSLVRDLKGRMEAFRDKAGADAFMDWQDRCMEAVERECPNTEERERYRLWHVLVGDSVNAGQPYFDFSGEASIQQMIERLEV